MSKLKFLICECGCDPAIVDTEKDYKDAIYKYYDWIHVSTSVVKKAFEKMDTIAECIELYNGLSGENISTFIEIPVENIILNKDGIDEI